MKKLAELAILSLALFVGCGPRVRTDCQLLGQKIRPGARIRCVADFACLRWQDDGLILSTMDSWRLGDEYLEKICERLREKGYAVANDGVVDVNWMFRDGARVPVVRQSGFWFGKKYDLARKNKEEPWTHLKEEERKKRRKDRDDDEEEPKIQVVFDSGRRVVEFEPDIWGKDESVPVAPERVPKDKRRLGQFVLRTVRQSAPVILAPEHLKKQEETDIWTQQVLASRVADPNRLQEHCPAPDLLLVLWGCAVAVSEKQDPLAAFGGLIGGQPATPKPTVSGKPGNLADPTVLVTDLHPYVPRSRARSPRHLVEFRGALLDPATGQILWFAAQRADQKLDDDDSDDECIFLPGPQARFARKLLVGFPRARHLGTDKSYSKSLSSFQPHRVPQ